MLVIRAQRGERDTIAERVRLWQTRLWHLALAKLNDEEAAWDVTQDAWLSILRGLPRPRQPETFGCWVMKIVANATASRLRCNRRPAGVIESLKTTASHSLPTADLHIDRQLLSALPETQLRSLVMHY